MPEVTLQTQCPLCASPSLRPVRTERTDFARHHQPKVRAYHGAWIQLVQCRGCTFGFTKELPPPEFFEARYDIPFDPDAESANPFKDHVLRALLDEVEALGVRGGRWLDVGSFAGILLRAASARGFEAFGVEVNPTLAEHCQKAQGLTVFNGSIFDFEAPAGHYQVLSLIDVLEHLPRPRQVLTRAFELLAPDGLLILKVPNFGPQLWKQRVANALRLSPTGVFENFGHINHFTPPALTQVLQRTGFEVLKVQVAASEHLPHTTLGNQLRNQVRDALSLGLQGLGRHLAPRLGFNLVAFARRRTLS
jgi:SAM-dependent methyltransferase